MTDDDLGFSRFADLLQANFVDDLTAWRESPFLWIRTLSAKKKGAAMEALVRHWCDGNGFPTTKSPGSSSDCLICAIPTEIKGSTLWDAGVYQFNQIRPQDYDLLALLGISPDHVNLWFPPKEICLRNSKPQHGGASGRDTFFLKFPVTEVPSWLTHFGGTPLEAHKALRTATQFFSPLLFDEDR